jgi:serine/threonine protein kinase
MDAISLDGKYLGSVSFPLSKAGSQLRNLCMRQKPRVIFLLRDDIVQAVVKICLSHEYLFNEIVRRIFPRDFFPEVLAHENSLIIFQNITPVSSSIKSLKHALENADVNMIKSILAQILALWIYAHNKDGRFSHNDLKADNVLLTPEKQDFIHIGDYEIKSFGVRVVIIDFETASGNFFPVIKVDVSQKMLLDYGLDPSLPFSPWTDVHLVFMEVYRHKIPGFEEFVERYYSKDIFEVGSPYVTCHNRLNARGRESMNAHTLQDVLADTFFNS